MSISMLILAILSKNFQDNTSNFSTSVALLILIYVFVAAYAFSWGPVPWVYCAEIFPLTMRAKATSLTTAANWATNCVHVIYCSRTSWFPLFCSFHHILYMLYIDDWNSLYFLPWNKTATFGTKQLRRKQSDICSSVVRNPEKKLQHSSWTADW